MAKLTRQQEKAMFAQQSEGKTYRKDYGEQTQEKHTHWVEGKKWNTRKKHPVSQKHRSSSSQFRHDLKTGKAQRWFKRKKLHMTDANKDRYIKEVIEK